ncbi:putative dynamin central domain, Dynamin superfamily [Helianthus anomalus]
MDGSLGYFKGPAEASVDAVHFILKELVRKSIAETVELKRFPSLQADIANAANESLEKFRDESRKTVSRLVEMESTYLTVDFYVKFMSLISIPETCLTRIPEMISILETISIRDDKHSRDDKYSNRSGPNAAPDRYDDYHFRKIGSNVSAYFGSGVSLPKYSHSKMPLAVHLLMLLVVLGAGRLFS